MESVHDKLEILQDSVSKLNKQMKDRPTAVVQQQHSGGLGIPATSDGTEFMGIIKQYFEEQARQYIHILRKPPNFKEIRNSQDNKVMPVF